MSNEARVNWIDTAKFLGIFAIIYGHTVLTGFSNQYVYSFHVPLFFFLQGCVAGVSSFDKYKPLEFIKKKSYTMLVPYYFFAFASVLIIFIASKFISIDEAIMFENPLNLFLDVISGYCLANRPLWFLPCSFVLSIIMYFIFKLRNVIKSNALKKLVLPFFAFLSVIILFITELVNYKKFLPFEAETAIYMISFFIVGYIFVNKRIFEKILSLKLWALVIAITSILVGGALAFTNSLVGYLGAYYGNVFLFLLSALCTILGLCLICAMLPNIKFLNYIGKSTLCILLIHKFPVLLFQKIIPFTKALLNSANVFVGILVTIVAISVCLISQLVLERLLPFTIGKKYKKIPKEANEK